MCTVFIVHFFSIATSMGYVFLFILKEEEYNKKNERMQNQR